MKVILENTQPLLGDRMMFTPLVRDLKAAHPHWEIGVISASPEVWFNNPHISHVTHADKHFNVGPGKVTRGSKTNGLHVTAAFRMSLQEKLDEMIPQGPFKADIHLSETEKATKIIDGHYWVINIDTKNMSAKRWPVENFQQVIDDNPDLTFVQVGLPEDNRAILNGDNVINLVGQTTIRKLFSLVYNAAGCISLVSSLMHVAGAFDKPCVVLAGGREPPTFERYAMHRYLDNVGCLTCCKHQACWHNALSACEKQDNGYAMCMRMIQPGHVTDAILSYYSGGVLSIEANQAQGRKKKVLRIVTKSICYGGAERSVVQIARLSEAQGWHVELCTTAGPNAEMVADLPAGVNWTNRITAPCDVLLFYASDMVFELDKPQYEAFTRLQAKRKVMALTYKIGKAASISWARGWDKYLFLSSAMQNEFITRAGIVNEPHRTDYLAPAVDLAPFLTVQPNYNGSATRVLNHTSQGDKKHSMSIAEIISNCSNVTFGFMPGPSWLQPGSQVQKHQPAQTPEAVAEFLSCGNLYWYLLPAGYTDQGPRVIVEAMAAGLPVIAENRDGAKDRVTPETGWLINDHDEAIDIINNVDSATLKRKGQAGRKRAVEKFTADNWYNHIIGKGV